MKATGEEQEVKQLKQQQQQQQVYPERLTQD